jgi:tetratricopeptide (TPR) repeat protein
VEEEKLSPKRVELVLGEVSQEFSDNSRMEETLLLCEFRFELSQGIPEARTASINASQAAEIASILGNLKKALLYLGHADTWSEKSKFTGKGEPEPLWHTLRANILFNRGRTLFRLAENDSMPSIKSMELLNESLKAFNDTCDFAKSHRAAIKGNVDFFTAEVIFWKGKVFLYMGKPKESLQDFRLVQSILRIYRDRFAAELVANGRLWEADAAQQAGLVEEAIICLKELLTDPTVPGEIKQRAEGLLNFLSDSIIPYLEWYDTSEGKSVVQSTLNEGLRQTVAKQIAPLVSWWERFHGRAEVELLDIWGRGGFARIAATVSGSPHNAVAVDARSVEEIAHWARVFCPLFETVIIKWKGVLEACFSVAPIPLELGPPGYFGAQGYVRTGDYTNDGWNVGVGWANLMPKEVVSFLFGEALPLFETGRLVVLPASLVGCTQHAVGWTDIFLSEKLLRGIINVVGSNEPADIKPDEGRIIDLAKVTIPYIEGISMGDLSSVLEDAADFLNPFQVLLSGMICENNLRVERWDKIRALEYDVRQASQKLNEKFNFLTRKKSGEKWRIKEHINGLSVSSSRTEHPGFDPVSNLLVSLTSKNPDLEPWIPYWRLQSCGGILDWTHRFNNKSQPPDINDIKAQIFGFNRQDHQTWLYPGDGGPGMISSIPLDKL